MISIMVTMATWPTNFQYQSTRQHNGYYDNILPISPCCVQPSFDIWIHCTPRIAGKGKMPTPSSPFKHPAPRNLAPLQNPLPTVPDPLKNSSDKSSPTWEPTPDKSSPTMKPSSKKSSPTKEPNPVKSIHTEKPSPIPVSSILQPPIPASPSQASPARCVLLGPSYRMCKDGMHMPLPAPSSDFPIDMLEKATKAVRKGVAKALVPLLEPVDNLVEALEGWNDHEAKRRGIHGIPSS